MIVYYYKNLKMAIYDFKSRKLTEFNINDPLHKEIKTNGVIHMADEKQQPAKKFRVGGVTATVWKNTVKVNGADREAFSVSIVKSYKEKDSDEWKETNSYFENDLPKLEAVRHAAYNYIVLQEDK